MRVIATGAGGSRSPPSPEVLARPQPYSPRMLAAVVNGRTLTMRFDRELDTSSVPDPGSFVVLVEGGLREVDSVDIVDDSVELTLERPVSAANTVTAGYIGPMDPGASFLRDVFGGYVPSPGRGSSLYPATNETDPD